jgi:ankyrin repeat protein
MTWTNLHEACENGRPENVIEAAQKHPEDVLSVDDHGSTPMHLLVWRNPDPLVVKALLEACPQAASAMDYHGDLPLHVAVSRPGIRMGVIQLLMPAYPTATSITNREGLTPLHMALRHAPSNEDIIRLLVEDYPFALTKPIKVSHLHDSSN